MTFIRIVATIGKGDLAPDQRTFVLAYRPGGEPTETEKPVARIRIEELLFKDHRNAKQQDLAPGEIAILRNQTHE